MTTTTDPIPSIMTIPEAAQILRVNPATIRKAILRGELQALRAGAQYRILRQDLSAYLRREAK